MDGVIHVYTWREGLLARVGHDLRLVTEAVPRREGEEWVVGLPATTVRVEGAMRGDRLDPTGLSAKDRAEIEHAMRTDVLDVRRFPDIVFRGRLDGGRAVGTLTLHGRTVPLTVPVRVDGSRARGDLEIAPSRWGIAPYRALLGALRLQDRVKIAFDLPLGPE